MKTPRIPPAALFLGIGVLAGLAIPRTPREIPGESKEKESISGETLHNSPAVVSPETFDSALKSVSEKLVVQNWALTEEQLSMMGDFGRIAEREGFPESIAKVCSSLEDASQKLRLLSAIFRRWSELSPESAAEALNSLPRDLRVHCETVVVASWLEREPSGAVAWIQGDPGRTFSYETLAAVLRTIAGSDPARAVRLQSEPPFASPGLRRSWSDTIVEAWAVHDTDGALSYALQLDDSQRRGHAIKEAVTRWAANDFDGAWSWGMAVTDAEDRELIVKSLLTALSGGDPHGAMSRFETLPSGMDRDEILGAVIGGIAAQAPEEALQFVERIARESAKSSLVNRVLREWLESDQESAFLKALEAMPLGEQRNGILSAVIGKAASRDFEETLALVERVEPAGTREQMRVSAALSLLRSFPERALEWAGSLPQGKSRERIFSEITQYHAYDDPEGMVELAIREGWWNGDSHTLLEPVLEKWAYLRPEDAANWIVKNTDSAFAERMAPAVVNTWMRSGNDTAGAKRWVSDLPEGELRSRAMEKIAGVLAATDSEAATAWLGTLPKGPDRDRAIRNFALVTVGVDPSAAMQWAAAIGEESRRENSLRGIARKWSETDRAAAISWLRGRNFSETWIGEAFSGVNTR